MKIAPIIVSTSTVVMASMDMKEAFPSILAVTDSFLTVTDWWLGCGNLSYSSVQCDSVLTVTHSLLSKPTRHGKCWELTDYILYKLNNNDYLGLDDIYVGLSDNTLTRTYLIISKISRKFWQKENFG